MHHQKTKKKIVKKHKKSKLHLQSEFDSYKADNPLTKYFEKVCGINSTAKIK